METFPQTAVRMEQKMHIRKKRKGRMTLLVSAGSIMLFGVIGVLMAWMSGMQQMTLRKNGPITVLYWMKTVNQGH